MRPAELWRRWRRLPASSQFESRAEAFEMACALHAAGHERVIADVANAFASKGSGS